MNHITGCAIKIRHHYFWPRLLARGPRNYFDDTGDDWTKIWKLLKLFKNGFQMKIILTMSCIYEIATWNCNLKLQSEITTWNCNLKLQSEIATWNCNLKLQPVITTWNCNLVWLRFSEYNCLEYIFDRDYSLAVQGITFWARMI